MDPKESAAGLPMYPVAGWDIGPIPGHDFVALRLHVRTTPHDNPEHVELQEILVLRPQQAMALSIALAAKVEELARLQTPPTGSAH